MVQTNSGLYGVAAKANLRPQQNNWRAQGNSAPVNAVQATGAAAYVPQPQQFPPLLQPQVQQSQLPRPQLRQQQQGAVAPVKRGDVGHRAS